MLEELARSYCRRDKRTIVTLSIGKVCDTKSTMRTFPSYTTSEMADLDTRDDDFVFTISDDDALDFVEEDEEQEQDPASQTSKIRKKRKREDPGLKNGENPTTKFSKKKRKTNNQPSELAASAQNTEEEEDESFFGSLGRNDGAIDPDFEFQVGDVDAGTTEDFDGWGNETWVAQKGDKKGIDIDELISRKRRKSSKEGPISETVGTEADEGDEEEASGLTEEFAGFESDSAGSDSADGDAEVLSDDDELLPPDGFGMGVTGSDAEDEGNEVMLESDEETPLSDDDSIASPVPHPDDLASDISSIASEDDHEEAKRRKAFFAPEEPVANLSTSKSKTATFQNLSLSRPILRGLASIGFSVPTPIQSKTIPMALLGKDVVGGAVTGSGKTAAFMIPILERLLYRPRKIPTSRVAILMPTRELAVQCFNVSRKLASFTDVSFCQLVGGFSLREQENVLKSRPDVIIATPGRFIDHMRNSQSFTVDTLEILVLDEADRMLEDGFADELNEILRTIPKSRQTMLFSATMTSSVDNLIRLGLNRPVRLVIDPQKTTVRSLTQEFVRLRPGNEHKRLSYLLHLCSTLFTDRAIVFFRQKKEAHRVRVIFGLCGFRASELHGSMTQEQRIAAVENFRSGKTTHLLATDVASRGLDIKNVETVINYEAPQNHSIYLHRVGRTARAGRVGRAVTIAAEGDRKVVKEAVKAAKAQGAKIVSRTVEPEFIDTWEKKLKGLEDDVEEILTLEKEEKLLANADMQVRSKENFVEHQDEIMSKPKRTWFESETEKRKAQERGRKELNGEEGVKEKKIRAKAGKLSGKEKKAFDKGRERREEKVWKKGKKDAEEARKGRGGKEKAGKDKDKGGLKVRKGNKGGRRPKKGKAKR